MGVSVGQDAMEDKTSNSEALLCGKQTRSSFIKRCQPCRGTGLASQPQDIV